MAVVETVIWEVPGQARRVRGVDSVTGLEVYTRWEDLTGQSDRLAALRPVAVQRFSDLESAKAQLAAIRTRVGQPAVLTAAEIKQGFDLLAQLAQIMTDVNQGLIRIAFDELGDTVT